MSRSQQHPTIAKVSKLAPKALSDSPLDASWLRQLCLECGADDVGFVELERPALDAERADILRILPNARAVISIVLRMNRDNVRSPARSVANAEFHHTGDSTNIAARQIVRRLEDVGIRAVNPPMAFPMQTERWPEKMWTISHKPIAVAGGLGHIGIHRNVIHPRFGSFILLGTVLLAASVSEYGQPLDYNPCLECKLCVAACPVGAISPDGHFNLSACYHHNYREFMGGFGDFVDQIAESKNARQLHKKLTRAESVSMWQSLGFGPNYKSGNCVSVCPAGEDVIMPYLSSKPQYLNDVVRPLQQNQETVYVVPGSDADVHVARRFPHKPRKLVRASLIPRTIEGFLNGLPLVFQRAQSAGLNAVYHFTFTGASQVRATVVIRDQSVSVVREHEGIPDLRISVDSATWLGFLARERSLIWALVRGKLRLKGPIRLLRAFGKCFPS